MKIEDVQQIREALSNSLKQVKAKSKGLIEKEKNETEIRYYNGVAKGYKDAIKIIDQLIKSVRESETKNFYPVISMSKKHLADRKLEGYTVESVTTLCGTYLRDSIVVLDPRTKESTLMDEDICLNCRRSALKN